MVTPERIKEFFDFYNITPKKENARSYIFDCPVCGGKEKLYIEKNLGRGVCFRHKTEDCPTVKTSIAKILSLISGIPYEDVKIFLNKAIIVSPEEILPTLNDGVINTKKPLPEKLEEVQPKDYPPEMILIKDSKRQNLLLKDAISYLENRGLDVKNLEKYNIGYSPPWRRVIFNVIHEDKYYGWQARTIDKNAKLRMFNLPGNWKSKTLMFYNNLFNSEHAILAEGAVSALKFEEVGGFVASMGKIVSDEQLDLVIKSGVKKIYLALDPDAINEMMDLTKRIYQKTLGHLQVFLIKVPKGKEDFGDCSYEECKKCFYEAIPVNLDSFPFLVYQWERG